jgi:hypothetical protein
VRRGGRCRRLDLRIPALIETQYHVLRFLTGTTGHYVAKDKPRAFPPRKQRWNHCFLPRLWIDTDAWRKKGSVCPLHYFAVRGGSVLGGSRLRQRDLAILTFVFSDATVRTEEMASAHPQDVRPYI